MRMPGRIPDTWWPHKTTTGSVSKTVYDNLKAVRALINPNAACGEPGRFSTALEESPVRLEVEVAVGMLVE